MGISTSRAAPERIPSPERVVPEREKGKGNERGRLCNEGDCRFSRNYSFCVLLLLMMQLLGLGDRPRRILG